MLSNRHTDNSENDIMSCLQPHLGSETDAVIKEVDLKVEKRKIYCKLNILDEREKEVVFGRFGLNLGEADTAGDCEKSGDLAELCS